MTAQWTPVINSVEFTLQKATSGAICTHTGRCKKVWTCPEPQCGKAYTKQCKLKVHMMMHSGVRPYKVSYTVPLKFIS